MLVVPAGQRIGDFEPFRIRASARYPSQACERLPTWLAPELTEIVYTSGSPTERGTDNREGARPRSGFATEARVYRGLVRCGICGLRMWGNHRLRLVAPASYDVLIRPIRLAASSVNHMSLLAPVAMPSNVSG